MKRRKGRRHHPGQGCQAWLAHAGSEGLGWGSGVSAHRNERNAKTLRAALLKSTPALWNAIPGRTLLLPGDSGLRHQPWIRCIYPEALIKMQDSAVKYPDDGKLNKFTAPGK